MSADGWKSRGEGRRPEARASTAHSRPSPAWFRRETVSSLYIKGLLKADQEEENGAAEDA